MNKTTAAMARSASPRSSLLSTLPRLTDVPLPAALETRLEPTRKAKYSVTDALKKVKQQCVPISHPFLI